MTVVFCTTVTLAFSKEVMDFYFEVEMKAIERKNHPESSLLKS